MCPQVVFMATLARNAINWEEMRDNERKTRTWREIEEMEREEIFLSPLPPSLSISSLYLHFPILSPSLHSLPIGRIYILDISNTNNYIQLTYFPQLLVEYIQYQYLYPTDLYPPIVCCIYPIHRYILQHLHSLTMPTKGPPWPILKRRRAHRHPPIDIYPINIYTLYSVCVYSCCICMFDKLEYNLWHPCIKLFSKI